MRRGKMFFISFQKLFSFSRKLKFKINVQMFKFYDVIKCLSIKKKYILLNNLGSKRSQLTKFGQFIYYKRKKYQKILQKLPSENSFQALLCLQRIKHKLYQKKKFLKQTTYIKYPTAKPSKSIEISMLTTSDSFLQRIP